MEPTLPNAPFLQGLQGLESLSLCFVSLGEKELVWLEGGLPSFSFAFFLLAQLNILGFRSFRFNESKREEGKLKESKAPVLGVQDQCAST